MDVLLVLISFVFLAVGLVALVRPIPKIGIGSRKRAGLVIAGAFGIFVLAATIGVSQMENSPAGAPAKVKPAPPRPEKASLRDIAEVKTIEVSNDVLNVELALPTGWDDASYVDSLGMTLKDIGQHLQKGVLEDTPGINHISISSTVPGSDRLGNDITIDFINVTVPADDLRRAKFENLSSSRTLNLATAASYANHNGASSLEAWCPKHQDARAFCLMALN